MHCILYSALHLDIKINFVGQCYGQMQCNVQCAMHVLCLNAVFIFSALHYLRKILRRFLKFLSFVERYDSHGHM